MLWLRRVRVGVVEHLDRALAIAYRKLELSCPGFRGGSETRIRSSSKELQVHAQSQEVFRGADRGDGGLRPDLPTTEEREEIRKLRKENHELRRANEILKAASVFFATELDADRPR